MLKVCDHVYDDVYNNTDYIVYDNNYLQHLLFIMNFYDKF